MRVKSCLKISFFFLIAAAICLGDDDGELYGKTINAYLKASVTDTAQGKKIGAGPKNRALWEVSDKEKTEWLESSLKMAAEGKAPETGPEKMVPILELLAETNRKLKTELSASERLQALEGRAMCLSLLRPAAETGTGGNAVGRSIVEEADKASAAFHDEWQKAADKPDGPSLLQRKVLLDRGFDLLKEAMKKLRGEKGAREDAGFLSRFFAQSRWYDLQDSEFRSNAALREASQAMQLLRDAGVEDAVLANMGKALAKAVRENGAATDDDWRHLQSEYWNRAIAMLAMAVTLTTVEYLSKHKGGRWSSFKGDAKRIFQQPKLELLGVWEQVKWNIEKLHPKNKYGVYADIKNTVKGIADPEARKKMACDRLARAIVGVPIGAGVGAVSLLIQNAFEKAFDHHDADWSSLPTRMKMGGGAGGLIGVFPAIGPFALAFGPAYGTYSGLQDLEDGKTGKGLGEITNGVGLAIATSWLVNSSSDKMDAVTNAVSGKAYHLLGGRSTVATNTGGGRVTSVVAPGGGGCPG